MRKLPCARAQEETIAAQMCAARNKRCVSKRKLFAKAHETHFYSYQGGFLVARSKNADGVLEVYLRDNRKLWAFVPICEFKQ